MRYGLGTKLIKLGLFLTLSCLAQQVDYVQQVKNKPNFDTRLYAKKYKSTTTTCGIQEAITDAVSAGGGTVQLNNGTTCQPTSAIHIYSNIHLQGVEGSTILKLPDGSIAANSTWANNSTTGLYCLICMESGINEIVSDLTIDGNGANQTWFYYGEISSYNIVNSKVENVTILHHAINGGTGVVVQFLGHSPITSNQNNIISHVKSFGIPNCTVPNGGGAYYLEGEQNRIEFSYAQDYCDSVFVLAACDHCGIYNSVADLKTGQMATPTFSVEGATGSIVSGNHCVATGTNGNRACFGVQSATGGLGAAIGNIFSGNNANHCSDAQWVGPTLAGTDVVQDTIITGLHADNLVLNGIVITKYVNKLTISNSTLIGGGGANVGIAIDSDGANSYSIASNIIVDTVTIDHMAQYGILTQGTNGAMFNNLTIKNSFIGDTNVSPSQQIGVYILNDGTTGIVNITGNILLGNTSGPWALQGTFTTGSIFSSNVLSTSSITYASGYLPSCNSGTQGNSFLVSDSTSNVWGAVAGPSGANIALLMCDGTNYTVVGK